MKKLLTLALLSASIAYTNEHEHEEAVLSEAPVVEAGVAALEVFKASFEVDGKTLGSELVGFNSKNIEEETESLVYSIPEQGKLKDNQYSNCHYDHDEATETEKAHCEGEPIASDSRDYTPSDKSFSVNEFKKAAEQTITEFRGPRESPIRDPKKIHEAKFWRMTFTNALNRKSDFIQIRYKWLDTNAQPKEIYYDCNYHAHGQGPVDFHCHERRLANTFEP